jgi:hypothetical protein
VDHGDSLCRYTRQRLWNNGLWWRDGRFVNKNIYRSRGNGRAIVSDAVVESSPEQPGGLGSGMSVVGPDAVADGSGETNVADPRRGLRERLGVIERLGVSERAAFWLGIAGIVAVAAILRLVNLSTRGTWDADQGHDMLVLRDLVQRGQVPLPGPPTSIVAAGVARHDSTVRNDRLVWPTSARTSHSPRPSSSQRFPTSPVVWRNQSAACRTWGS